MAICHRCGLVNAADAASCNECGAPLSVRSGAELPQPPASYTPPHLTEKILRSRHAIAGERKHVTVVFCDVVGSTRLADELGP
jgi:class 3 adenylate cyclase